MFGPQKQLSTFLLGVLALAGMGATRSPTGDEATVYATVGGVLEVDTCASAWALRRFVDSEAVFRFHPRNTVIREGVQFDTPGAKKYARRPNLSILETIIGVHRLDNPALLRLARVIRDVEINKWGKKATPEAAGLARIVSGLNRISKDETECLRRSFVVFDALYADFKAESK